MAHIEDISEGTIIKGLLPETPNMLVKVTAVERTGLFQSIIYGLTLLQEYVGVEVDSDGIEQLQIMPRAGEPVAPHDDAMTHTSTPSSPDDVAMLYVRIADLEMEVNQLQVAEFVRNTIMGCGLALSHANIIAEQFTGATCGPRGTYQDPQTLEAAVRAAVRQYMQIRLEPTDPTL